MTHRPQLIKTASAGRPLALIPGPDGQPLRMTAVTRTSQGAPARLKVALAGPVAMPEGTGAACLAEFRMELN